MTKLACRYGIDAARPEKGVIVEFCADDQILDMTAHAGCLQIVVPEPAETWGRFGPEPELMGEPPTGCYPCHAELDAARVPDDHHLRRVAGLPMPDNRRRALDMRLLAAPDLTPGLARAARVLELTAVFDAAAIAGFRSAALGAVRIYPSDADGERKLQLAALAALGGQSKLGWTATLRCAEPGSEMVGVPHTAAQVHAVLADYQSFADALHDERDAVLARVASALTVPDILSVSRG